MDYVNDLRRRHRGFVLFSAMVFIWLVFVSVRFLLHLFWLGSNSSAIHFTREWGMDPIFAALWTFWLITALDYRRHRSRHRGFDKSTQTSLSALLDENRLTRTRTKLVCALLGVVVLMVPIVIHQLKAAGKAGNEIDPALVFVPIVLGGVFVGLVFHYRRTLLVEKQRFEALLQSYEGSSFTAEPST